MPRPWPTALWLLSAACMGSTDDATDTFGEIETGDIPDSDPGDSSDSADTADTPDSGDTADSSDTDDTGDTADSGDTGDTADSGDTADTADSGDTADTADSGDSDDSDETLDTDTDTDLPAPPPPTNAADLLLWLEAGHFLDWPAEPSPRPATPVHGSPVQVYMNPALDGSMRATATEHPVGAATVKVLNADQDPPGGYAVMVKVATGTAENSWYWYEIIGTSVVADGTNVPGCSGCHSASLTDHVRTPWPP